MAKYLLPLLLSFWINILPASGFEDGIRIGMLIPGEEGKDAVRAAELAIAEANKSGGYKGIPFELVVKAMEGPWGAGAGQTVDLIFEDNVVAILGSLDGRNAHLAEQVATKGHVVMLSTWATDPTLSQAFVPWYFRCIPNADQQVKVLYDHIIGSSKKSPEIILLHDASYDASLMAKSFIKTIAMEQPGCPPCISWKEHSSVPGVLDKKLLEIKSASIVFFAMNENLPALLSKLRGEGFEHPVITGLADPISTVQKSMHTCLFPGNAMSFPESGFFKEYRETYGHSPGTREAYAYDGTNLILESIRKAGTDPEAIRDTLAGISFPEAVTGSIRFDKNGNLEMDEDSLVPLKSE